MSKLSKLAWILTGIAGLSVAAAVVVTVGPKAKEIKNINLGNKYLREMDYESAMVAYNVAIEVNPNSKEAIEGLMQAAFSKGDYDTLISSVEAYSNVLLLDETMSEDEEHMLYLMTTNAYDAFDSNEEYAEFVDKLCANSQSDEFAELKKDAYYAYLGSLIRDEKYEEANALVDEMLDVYEDETIESAKANALEKCAEEAWRKREFAKALEYLKEALEYAKDDQVVKDHLLRVIEDYAVECKNNQDYDLANELISYIQDLRGDDSLSEIGKEIAEMEEADNTLQDIIETLNSYFEADDIASISALMTSPEFKDNALKVKRVLYSNTVKASGDLSGRGTAIYNVGGVPYVYYGSFAGGKRSGSGLWYYATDRGDLSKYTLEWVNDLPNGAGTLDYYANIDTVGKGGVLLDTNTVHQIDTFTVVNGIMTGQYNSEYTQYGYTIRMSCVLEDGYAPRIEPGDYPSEILEYMAYPKALAMYASYGYGGYSWLIWTPTRFMVSGIANCAENKTVDGSVDLVVE